MDKVERKKQLAIANIGGFLLENGLNENGIRLLAKAAGTSDRMLIYYFGSKDELMNQVLGAIAAGFSSQLDAGLGLHIREADQLLEELTQFVMLPAFQPAVQLWFELVGLAARGKEPYASNAKLLAKNWIMWIESRLEGEQIAAATDLYAHLEGRVMLKILEMDLPFLAE
ncbi:MAG: TetR/AcrR family transcriptional regulator [Chloroflexota bacterium]